MAETLHLQYLEAADEHGYILTETHKMLFGDDAC